MTTPLQTLRERIIELIPEIVELKFGCKIRRFSHYFPETLTYIKSYENDINQVEFTREDAPGNTFRFNISTPDIESWDILGRPIQLADVLRAIEEKLSLTGKDDWGVSVGCYWVASLLDPEQLTRWNLTKPLDDQSEETISFILRLLTNQ